MDEEIKKLRERLHNFVKKTTVYDMIAVSNSLCVISNKLSIADLINILIDNCEACALILDEEKEDITSVFVTVDLISVLLSFQHQNKHILNDDGQIDIMLNDITIKQYYAEYKDYSGKDMQNIVTIEVSLEDESENTKRYRKIYERENRPYCCEEYKKTRKGIFWNFD